MNSRILLIDGPLNGVPHELRGGMVPAQLALADLDYDPEQGPPKRRHWYKVSEDHQTATFVETKDCM